MQRSSSHPCTRKRRGESGVSLPGRIGVRILDPRAHGEVDMVFPFESNSAQASPVCPVPVQSDVESQLQNSL